MPKRTSHIPRWLRFIQQQVQTDGPSSHLPRWQEALWLPTSRQAPHRLALHGLLSFPSSNGIAQLHSEETQLSCRLEQLLTSPGGILGLHLVLVDEASSNQASALLLPPAAVALLQADSTWNEPAAQACSLDEPLVVLELPGVRGEFTLLEKSYDPARAEAELLHSQTLQAQTLQALTLQALTLQATVWRYPGEKNTGGGQK